MNISHGNAVLPNSHRRETGDDMNATQQLHYLGQSLWLDNSIFEQALEDV